MVSWEIPLNMHFIKRLAIHVKGLYGFHFGGKFSLSLKAEIEKREEVSVGDPRVSNSGYRSAVSLNRGRRRQAPGASVSFSDEKSFLYSP